MRREMSSLLHALQSLTAVPHVRQMTLSMMMSIQNSLRISTPRYLFTSFHHTQQLNIKMSLALITALASSALLATAQIVRTDPGVYGPALEIAHLFNDQWPTGVAVSASGRIFANYPSGL